MTTNNFPIFDGKESLTHFIRRVKDFELQVLKEKYDLILEFVNELMNKEKKYISLTEFINEPDHIITSNVRHNKKVINIYKDKLAKVLNINVLELTCITSEEDTIESSFTIIFLKKIINSINFSLVSRIVDDKIYYSIKNKIPNKN